VTNAKRATGAAETFMAELRTIWRDLKCTQCNQINGFTNGVMKMDNDYEMRYYCHTCQDIALQEFVGELYARDGKMQRIQDVLDFTA
jgi:hypothetical protein